MAFNNNAAPKVKTKFFRIYVDVSDSESASPEWELQGRGVESWTINQNQDITKTPDVLGFIDMERSEAQPVQSGIKLQLRQGSRLSEMLFEAMYTGNTSSLDAVKILQKFEFVDGDSENTCKARLEEDVMIGINSFTGEASGDLGFDVDFHYANKRTLGSMPKVDGETITFTPDSAA